jgi:hypothetical protein
MTNLARAVAAFDRAVRQERAIARALAKLETTLQRKANVVGYGVGYKRTRGKLNRSEPVAVFFVTRKVARDKLAPKDRLPKWINVGSKRVATDVVRLPRFRFTADASANCKKMRPVEMGAQIGICVPTKDDQLSWGTAGAMVNDKKTPIPNHFMLSAAHVMYGTGHDVIEPSHESGGHNPDFNQRKQSPPVVLELIGSTILPAFGGIDAELAEVSQQTSPAIIGLGRPQRPVAPTLGLPVQKSGAKTGVTMGEVGASSVAVFNSLTEWMWKRPYAYEIFGNRGKPGSAMRGLFIVTPKDFGDKGDSGALIIAGPDKALDNFVDSKFSKLPDSTRHALAKSLSNRALGLLIGVGYAEGAVGQEIQLALDALKVQLD